MSAYTQQKYEVLDVGIMHPGEVSTGALYVQHHYQLLFNYVWQQHLVLRILSHNGQRFEFFVQEHITLGRVVSLSRSHMNGFSTDTMPLAPKQQQLLTNKQITCVPRSATLLITLKPVHSIDRCRQDILGNVMFGLNQHPMHGAYQYSLLDTFPVGGKKQQAFRQAQTYSSACS